MNCVTQFVRDKVTTLPPGEDVTVEREPPGESASAVSGAGAEETL